MEIGDIVFLLYLVWDLKFLDVYFPDQDKIKSGLKADFSFSKVNILTFYLLIYLTEYISRGRRNV